jgi:hypothetical protein
VSASRPRSTHDQPSAQADGRSTALTVATDRRPDEDRGRGELREAAVGDVLPFEERDVGDEHRRSGHQVSRRLATTEQQEGELPDTEQRQSGPDEVLLLDRARGRTLPSTSAK